MSTAAPVLGPQQTGPGSLDLDSRKPRWLPSFDIVGLAGRVPLEDWITFGLLGVMLAAVGWSVQLAGWGDLPSILPTLLLGWTAGFIASRSSLPVVLKVAVALGIGFAVVMWQGSIPADGSNVADRARDAWERFWLWISIAKEGGVSNDSVPFALMFMTASWITAYTVTSLTYRVRNPWTPVVLLAVGLMSNLSFRPGLHEHTFFIFILASIALFAHLTAVRRMDRWSKSSVNHPRSHAWLSMGDGLLFGIIVVAIALVLPLVEPRSSTLDDAWEVLKAPIDALQEPANRLLSGVKANDEGGGLSLPNDVLTFKGAITLTDEPLVWVTSRYATMLPGRVYDEYASTGWLATSDVKRTVSASQEVAPLPPDEGRERIEQLIQPLVSTNLVLPAGGVFSLDREAEVEYLQPAVYRVPLTGQFGTLADLPRDIRDLTFKTRFALRDIAERSPNAEEIQLDKQPLMNELQVQQVLEGETPDDVEIRLEINREGLVENMVLFRLASDEQIGAVLTEKIEAEHLYKVTTYVSIAPDADLQESGDDYPGWVEDRYLALPDSLPTSVENFANLIVNTAGAVTPYEKARAIQSFLQEQEYSLEISGPAANKDGVAYFLFETQNEPCPTDNPGCDVTRIKGYSQYYGSAGAVLLRAVGVPARMVAGWAAGEYVPAAGRFLIRDKDRHGWTQAYFEDYGWVDVEMTPGRAEPDRGVLFEVEPVSALGLPSPFGSDEELEFLDDLEDLEALRLAALQLAERDGLTGGAVDSGPFPFQFIIIPFSILGALALIYGGWRFWHRGMTPAESAYTKMVRAGALLGVGRKKWQTPTEYAATVGDRMPDVADSAMLLAIEFERTRYAHPDRDTSSEDGVTRHWRRVAKGMLGHRARLITRTGSPSVENLARAR